jgi:hypothetical protein
MKKERGKRTDEKLRKANRKNVCRWRGKMPKNCVLYYNIDIVPGVGVIIVTRI